MFTESSQIFSEWRQDVSMTGFGPPFDTAFYTVRVSVSSELPEIVKTVSSFITVMESFVEETSQ